MAFCTTCGGNVTGVFCTQCGTKVVESPQVGPGLTPVVLPQDSSSGTRPEASKTKPPSISGLDPLISKEQPKAISPDVLEINKISQNVLQLMNP